MQYCTECSSVEQGTITKVVDGEEIEVCAMCEMEAEECIRHFDEDYGQER
jgi:hypothetical protein